MSVQALGYIGLRAKDLGDWGSFGSDFLGMQRVDKTRSSMAFRMDDRKQRVIVDADGGQGIGYFGWEMADAAAMDGLAATLDAAGVKVARGARSLARRAKTPPIRIVGLHLAPSRSSPDPFAARPRWRPGWTPRRRRSSCRTAMRPPTTVALHGQHGR